MGLSAGWGQLLGQVPQLPLKPSGLVGSGWPQPAEGGAGQAEETRPRGHKGGPSGYISPPPLAATANTGGLRQDWSREKNLMGINPRAN